MQLLSIRLGLILETLNQCSWTFCPANGDSQLTKKWSLKIWSLNPRECELLLKCQEQNRVWAYTLWAGAHCSCGKEGTAIGNGGRRLGDLDDCERTQAGSICREKLASLVWIFPLCNTRVPLQTPASLLKKKDFIFFKSSPHVDLKEHSLLFHGSQTPSL